MGIINFSCTSKQGNQGILAFGLPTHACAVGKILSRKQDKAYVCRVCYAKVGQIALPHSQARLEKNLDGYFANQEAWRYMFVALLKNAAPKFFRWFHSGDLQEGMFAHIVAIAQLSPEIQFYLPTKEHAQVKTYGRISNWEIPANLTVRLAGHVIDEYPSLARTKNLQGCMTVYHHPCNCMAHHTGGQCQDCRLCWDKSVPTICYPLHVGRTTYPKETAKRLGLII